ncbi:hypothetical protein CsatB_006797 [Cannabis sativa]
MAACGFVKLNASGSINSHLRRVTIPIRAEAYTDELVKITVELQYFIELGALFEDVIALLSKFPGAVLSHGARSKIFAAHGWQSMLCG